MTGDSEYMRRFMFPICSLHAIGKFLRKARGCPGAAVPLRRASSGGGSIFSIRGSPSFGERVRFSGETPEPGRALWHGAAVFDAASAWCSGGSAFDQVRM